MVLAWLSTAVIRSPWLSRIVIWRRLWSCSRRARLLFDLNVGTPVFPLMPKTVRIGRVILARWSSRFWLKNLLHLSHSSFDNIDLLPRNSGMLWALSLNVVFPLPRPQYRQRSIPAP